MWDRDEGEGDVDRMVASRLATSWLALLALASVPGVRADGGGVVVVAVLDVFDEPDDTSYTSGRLLRGDRVAVVSSGRGGWMAIEPPAEAFDWVARDAIRDAGDGRAEVIVDRAPIRSGSPGARMPGPPRPSLPKGAVVVLVDRPPLALSQGRSTLVWRAIRPPKGEARFVRAEGVAPDPSSPASVHRARPRPTITGPRDVVVAVATSAPSEVSIAEAARRFDAAVARSRQRDDEVEQIRARLARARTASDRGYDAKGFLQASSRKVDGQKVHALIGPEGIPVAYLDIPPGIATAPLLARKIGVRGSARFVESLGTRLITVRDLDPLDDPR